MSYDFKIVDRDILITDQGDIVLATNKSELVQQWIEVAIKLMLGEWFVDKTQGTDWLSILSERDNRSTVDMQIKSIILKVPYVVKLLSYSSNLKQDNITLEANIQVQIEDGDILTLNNIQVT